MFGWWIVDGGWWRQGTYEAAVRTISHRNRARRIRSRAGAEPRRPAVPSTIPTVSLDNVARHGFFFAGGKYVGELGPNKESTMGGAMYVEVMVPRQIRSPYPDRLPSRRRADRRRLAADAGRPAGMGLQLPRHGLRRLPAGFSRRADARSTCRASTARQGSLNLNIRPRRRPRRDVHRVGGARRVSRRRRSTRSGRAPAASATKSSTTSPGRRCSSSRADVRRADARRERRAARHDRHAGHPAVRTRRAARSAG